ncbi:hypothetical protein [Hoeflea prorocentri]|uniref:Uncharacterized protein n=1 Tax=Hoeflea prorocentri TaxID=1922333 RepID=A0A9X3ZHM7_9HYPH|nr:hypothetical protein [Hoeflea prorocentri]MCY6381509.1 hypothetical protein [Hoeflea prorocentri]MDA5399309.1 hypothetical protein [Hoeflea prorocentri]
MNDLVSSLANNLQLMRRLGAGTVLLLIVYVSYFPLKSFEWFLQNAEKIDVLSIYLSFFFLLIVYFTGTVIEYAGTKIIQSFSIVVAASVFKPIDMLKWMPYPLKAVFVVFWWGLVGPFAIVYYLVLFAIGRTIYRYDLDVFLDSASKPKLNGMRDSIVAGLQQPNSVHAFHAQEFVVQNTGSMQPSLEKYIQRSDDLSALFSAFFFGALISTPILFGYLPAEVPGDTSVVGIIKNYPLWLVLACFISFSLYSVAYVHIQRNIKISAIEFYTTNSVKVGEYQSEVPVFRHRYSKSGRFLGLLFILLFLFGFVWGFLIFNLTYSADLIQSSLFKPILLEPQSTIRSFVSDFGLSPYLWRFYWGFSYTIGIITYCYVFDPFRSDIADRRWKLAIGSGLAFAIGYVPASCFVVFLSRNISLSLFDAYDLWDSLRWAAQITAGFISLSYWLSRNSKTFPTGTALLTRSIVIIAVVLFFASAAGTAIGLFAIEIIDLRPFWDFQKYFQNLGELVGVILVLVFLYGRRYLSSPSRVRFTLSAVGLFALASWLTSSGFGWSFGSDSTDGLNYYFENGFSIGLGNQINQALLLLITAEIVTGMLKRTVYATSYKRSAELDDRESSA